MTTETMTTTCKKCHTTLTSYDARFCQGYCKPCYNGTPIGADEDNGLTPCDDCEQDITDELYEANDGRCDGCRAAHVAAHFTCQDCEEECENDDRSEKCPTRCQGCQESRDEEEAQEALEAAQSELQELVDELTGLDDLDVLKRAIRALKRLQPK